MPTKSIAPQATQPVPPEFGGKWVAWVSDHSRIAAQSDTLQELWRIVHDRDIVDPVFEKVPHADVRFVGMR